MTIYWTRLISTEAKDTARAIAIGADGSVYVAGQTEGNLAGEPNFFGTLGFITKFNSDGTKAWTRLISQRSDALV
jgi:hypothetical protein